MHVAAHRRQPPVAVGHLHLLVPGHPLVRVAGYEQMKVADRDGWLAAMRRHVHREP